MKMADTVTCRQGGERVCKWRGRSVMTRCELSKNVMPGCAQETKRPNERKRKQRGVPYDTPLPGLRSRAVQRILHGRNTRHREDEEKGDVRCWDCVWCHRQSGGGARERSEGMVAQATEQACRATGNPKRYTIRATNND